MFLNFLKLRQLSPEPGSGGYSLDDLDKEEEEAEKELQEGNTLGDVDDKPKTPEEIAAEKKVADDKLALDKSEAEKKAAKEKADLEAKEATKKEPEDTDSEDETDEDNFWAEVDKLRGEELEVEYGDVDPMTPEGALIRENAVAEKATMNFESYLEQTQPKAYAYLMHKMEGGTDEEFFQMSAGTEDLPTPEQLENSEELQKKIVTRNMQAKGISEKTIATVIKGLITDDELEETAKEALAEENKTAAEKIELIKQNALQETAKKQQAIGKIVKYVNDVVSQGQVDNITIPEKDRKPFIDHFNKNVRYENGKFLLVQELSDDNIIQTFKKEFFNFKGGKIEDLIQKQARSENAKRLTTTLGKDKRVRTTAESDSSGFVSLGDL